MSVFTDEIRIIFKTVTGNASSDIKSMSTAMSQAEGVAGKAGAGFLGFGNLISGSSALAGGAVAALGVGAVKALANLATGYTSAAESVRTFHTVAGVSAEDASRWVTVSKDLGVSTESVQGAFAKLGKTLGKNPEALKDYGLQAAKASDGSVDLSKTLLAVTDQMAAYTDPTKRAALGTAAFGKSWQNVIPIVDAGSEKVKELAKSTGTIFSEKDLASARKFDENMAKISTSAEKAKNSIGLVAVETANEALADAGIGESGYAERKRLKREYANSVTGDIAGIYNAAAHHAADLAEAERSAAADQENLTHAVADSLSYWDAQTKAVENATKALDERDGAVTGLAGKEKAMHEAVAEAAKAVRAGGKDLDGAKVAISNVAQATLDYAAAQAAAKGGTLTAAQSNAILLKSYEDQIKTLAPNSPLRAQIQGYIDLLKTAPTDVNTQFGVDTSVATSDVGNWVGAMERNVIDMTVRPQIDPAAVAKIAADLSAAFSRAGAKVAAGGVLGGPSGYAEGGIVKARPGGQVVVVGEGGHDEAIIPLGPGGAVPMVPNNGRPAAVTNITNNVTVNAPPGTDARAVAAASRRYLRLNGVPV